MSVEYLSTKTYTHSVGLSCAFRQWRADSHCRFVHGYALEIRMQFVADDLDERNWVVDFGGLKSVKTWLEDQFDHKLVVAYDDPELDHFRKLDRKLWQLRLVPATGCEAFSRMVFVYLQDWLTSNQLSPRVKVDLVEVREHGGNSAITRQKV